MTDDCANALQAAHELLDTATCETHDPVLISIIDRMMREIRLILREKKPDKAIEVKS